MVHQKPGLSALRRVFVALVSLSSLSLMAFVSGCSGTGGSAPTPGTPASGNSLATTNAAPPSAAQTGASSVASTATLIAAAPGTDASITTYASIVKGDNPVAYYRMNDRSATTAFDSSGHGHNGTYTSGVRINQPALLTGDVTAKSANFSNGYATESATWPEQVVTAEAWIRPSAADVTGSPRILGNAWVDHSGNGYMLWLSAGTAAFNAGYLVVNSSFVLTAGQTYHIVGTYSVAAGAALYVNGKSVATHVTPGFVPKPQIGDSSTTYIGVLQTGRQFGLVEHFQGDVSDFAVYNHVLTAFQIANHYRVGTQNKTLPTPVPIPSATPTSNPRPTPTPNPKPTPTPSGAPAPSPTPLASPGSYVRAVKANVPLVFYRLNDVSGTTAVDSSGNGRSGRYNASVSLNQPAILRTDPAKSANFPTGYATENATWTAQAVTAEAWIRPTAADLSGAPRIVGNAWTDHDGKGFMLWISGGTAAFSAGYTQPTGTYPLVAGQTYHIVGTYSNATGTTLYINGKGVAHITPGALPTPQTGFTNTTYIGVLNAIASDANHGLAGYFQGSIADVAIYDHALTAQDVANHYNAGAAANVAPVPIATPAPTPAPPKPTAAPAKIVYNAASACINHALFTNNVLPTGEGEFGTNGLDRTYWGRTRGNPIGGNQYSGFSLSYGRYQYDTYMGDKNDGISTPSDDPFYVGPDTAAPGSPRGLRINAFPMPAHLVGNPKVSGAHYYSGALDDPINLQYGFFVARVRTPAPKPGMSPAFWMLTNNGVPSGAHGSLNGEWDIQEMFANDYGNGMNAGTLQWNSGATTPQNWGGAFNWPPIGPAESTTPSSDYHDWGVLLSPGGAIISANDYGPGGPGLVYGPTASGVTNFLDGVPLFGHTGGGDVTSGVAWKELFAMFQVAAPNSFLGNPNPADFPASYWVQWIRVYRPTPTKC